MNTQQQQRAIAHHAKVVAQSRLIAARVQRSIEHATRFQRDRQEILDELVGRLSLIWLNHRVKHQVTHREVDEASRKQRLAYHQRMVEKPLLPDAGRAYHKHMVDVLTP